MKHLQIMAQTYSTANCKDTLSATDDSTAQVLPSVRQWMASLLWPYIDTQQSKNYGVAYRQTAHQSILYQLQTLFLSTAHYNKSQHRLCFNEFL